LTLLICDWQLRIIRFNRNLISCRRSILAEISLVALVHGMSRNFTMGTSRTTLALVICLIVGARLRRNGSLRE